MVDWPGDDDILCSNQCATCDKHFEFSIDDVSDHTCDACDKPVCPECVLTFEKLNNFYEHCPHCYEKEFPDEF